MAKVGKCCQSVLHKNATSNDELLAVNAIIACRFFFISDDELLSVLGTSDPSSIQEHMLKLFDNCASLTFSRGNKVVTGMTSSEVCTHGWCICLPAHPQYLESQSAIIDMTTGLDTGQCYVQTHLLH